MCGGPKTDNTLLEQQQEEAARARAEEDARQARIAQGLESIRGLFEGGDFISGFNTEITPITPPEIQVIPSSITETSAGRGETNRVTTPDQFVVDGSTFGSLAGAEAHRATLPTTSETEVPIFDQSEGIAPVLDQRRQAMEGFFFPQFDLQYDRAKEDLTFALSDAGLLNSTMASREVADLSEQAALERSSIAADIDRDITSTQRNFENVRSQAEAQLRASGDVTSSTNAALRGFQAEATDQPTLSPLVALFAGATDGIGAAVRGFEAERTRQAFSVPSQNRNASRIVRG